MSFSQVNARKRILGSMLSQHLGESVCLLGTLVQLDASGKGLKMKTSDDQLVTVQLQKPPKEPIERILEVHGTLSPNNTIQCFKCITFKEEFTSNFDPALYNEVVDILCTHPSRYPVMN